MYVLIGGFRAVALSDTLLGIIMLVGTTIILIATVIAGGGIEKIMQELVQINPNLITPFGADGSLTKIICYIILDFNWNWRCRFTAN